MKIFKEVPTWIIDWVNRNFTLLNEIESVDDVFMDWAIYVDFRIVWRTLIFSDAPILSVYVDYISKDWNDNFSVDNTITLWKIITEVYNLTWQTPNSTNFNRDRVVRMINSVSDRVWKWKVTNLLNPAQIFRNSCMDFTIWRIWYKTIWKWTLSKILEIWDNEAFWDFSELYGAWFIKIWSDIVEYRKNWNDKITILDQINVKHFSWEKIKQLYKLPENFLSLKEISEIYLNKNYQLDLEKYEFLMYKWKVFVDLSKVFVWTEVELKYKRKYVNLVSDNDICIFPDNYWIDVIANLVAGELMYQRNMPNWQVLLADWYSYLQNMFQHFELNRKVEKNYIKPKKKWRILI